MTPEEFLRDKYKLVDFHNLTINGYSWLDLMKEYHKEMVEKVSGELPSESEHLKKVYELVEKYDSNSITTGDIEGAIESGIDWMKEQASVVISKLKNNNETQDKNVKELLKECETLYKKLEQKDKDYADVIYENVKIKDHIKRLFEEIKKQDKEIEELKNILDECRLQFEYLNGKFGETGTTNNILSKIINTNKP